MNLLDKHSEYAIILWLCITCTVAAPWEWKRHTVRQRGNGPQGRKYHAIGYDDQRRFLIIFGGLGANNTVLNDTWVLDTAAGAAHCETFAGVWYESKNGGHRPNARYGSVYGTYNGQLIMAAGCSHTHCFDDVWSFNPGPFIWTRIQVEGKLKPKPRGYASGGIHPHGTHVIISGGIASDGEYMRDIFSLDIARRRWHLLDAWHSTYDPGSPHPRAFQAAAIIEQNTLLEFGGCLKHGPCPSAHSWTFDSRIRTWTRLNMCPMARSSAAIATIHQDGVVVYAVMYGGNTGGRQIISSKKIPDRNELAVFDVQRKAWTLRMAEGAKSPGHRVGAGLASTGRSIYLFGGEIEGRFPNDVFILSGDPNATAPIACGESFFTLISLHGLMMFLGVAIFLQYGGALAQYSVLIKEPEMINWRYLHKVSQVLGLLFFFCAFVCGIAIIPDGNYHFRSVHGALGLFIFILLLIQAFLGFLSLHYHDLKKLILAAHFWIGVIVLLLAYINISLGLFLALSPYTLWISWFVYVLLICSIGCVILAYDCCKEKRLLARIVIPEYQQGDTEMIQPQQHQVTYATPSVYSYGKRGQ